MIQRFVIGIIVFFFFSFRLFDVALRPSDIFLDDRFMFLLFSFPHCPYRTFDHDHGLFTAFFFSLLLSINKSWCTYIVFSFFKI